MKNARPQNNKKSSATKLQRHSKPEQLELDGIVAFSIRDVRIPADRFVLGAGLMLARGVELTQDTWGAHVKANSDVRPCIYQLRQCGWPIKSISIPAPKGLLANRSIYSWYLETKHRKAIFKLLDKAKLMEA